MTLINRYFITIRYSVRAHHARNPAYCAWGAVYSYTSINLALLVHIYTGVPVSPPPFTASFARSCSASRSSFSLADGSVGWNRDSSSDGSCVTFRRVSLLVKGVHGPWMLGVSVCHVLRRRTVSFPECVRRWFTHWQMVSSLCVDTGISSRRPFTVSRAKYVS